nr:unnamed protein product [Callosobruchus analis]
MPTIFASKIRILPHSIHRRTVCLRMELLGCPYDGGIVSYSSPEGSEPSQGLFDSSYDGIRSNGYLTEGLGRLVDGEVGLSNFRLDLGYGKGNGWVSWKNDSMPNGYVELLFEFDQVRNFTAVHLYTNNLFSRNVQVFSKAKVMFSIGGEYFSGPMLSYTHVPDRQSESARNVTIDFHQKLAKFVKLRLYFADQRMMISEVVFESEATGFNSTEEDTNAIEEQDLIITSGGDKALAAFETIAARKSGDTYVEVIIGILTAIMLLLLIVFLVILVVNKRHKLQGSPTLLRNPFGVTINMKDLFMNFSNSNQQQTVISRPATPAISQLGSATPFDRNSQISYGQYRSSLETAYYAPNYTTLMCPSSSAAAADRSEEAGEAPEVPPLTDDETPEATENEKDDNEDDGECRSVIGGQLSYRSRQSTPSLSSKSQVINLGNYSPKLTADTTDRKRYHTSPRDNCRVSPTVICWNVAPSSSNLYKYKEMELVPIPGYSLRPVEKLGVCHAGSVTLYETEGLENILPGAPRLVAVRTSSSCTPKQHDGGVSAASVTETLREVRFLAGLSDPNICQVLGICSAEQPPWTVLEYGDVGDLAQYLQYLVSKNGALINGDQPISTGTLIFMATQIASAMKYLESKHVVHKDLAARNCLVGRGYTVKVADIAMCKPQYKKDYAEIGGRPPAPIRWLPWESILLDRYSCSSSVWSFAVTLWEILNFCCERPFSNLSNEKVIQNAEHMYYGGELQVVLNKPALCSPDIYELMCSCWRRDDNDRPTFKQIFHYLKHVNKEYTSSD